MQVLSLTTEHFRNLQNKTITFSSGMNVIYGDNAQGKTNLIEAIWLFFGAKSFRGAKETEMTAFSEEHTTLLLTFQDRRREQQIQLSFGRNGKKKILLNKVPLESQSKLAGTFYTVVFPPAHLSIIAEGPKNRRRFLDDAISQINPQYGAYLRQYEKVLDQRNALLKDCFRYPALRDTLDIWDLQLAKLGSILTLYRNDYVKKLNASAGKIYHGLSGKKEQFAVSYQSTVFAAPMEITAYDDPMIAAYHQVLREHQEIDLKNGLTTCGVHRDDLEVLIDSYSAKTYGSQGQKRSSALALKLAEAALLQQITGEPPVILLDDVMSELDVGRQEYILNHVKGSQVFLTCCDISNTLQQKTGKLFHVENGDVTQLREN